MKAGNQGDRGSKQGTACAFNLPNTANSVEGIKNSIRGIKSICKLTEVDMNTDFYMACL